MTKDDQIFIMNTARLECAIAENLNVGDIAIIQGKSKAWYLVSREKNEQGRPKKIYLKKVF